MSTKLIRDAVHGDMEFGTLELELIDTPEFQRLRGIRQLGTAYFVFPSAVHTRFEHSLGASWMAHRIVEAIRRSHSISKDDETRIRITSLLHDITHIPFGHTLEDELRLLTRHDEDKDRLCHFFEDSAVGKILAREGIQRAVLSAISHDGSLAADLAGGPISADLLDYLRRDTYFCGLAQHYDERIFNSLIAKDGRLVVDLEKRGVLRRDALSELVNLLRIRYTLAERVYFHHAKIASGAMVAMAVELALDSGFRANELWSLTDEPLVWILRERYSNNPAIVHILDCLRARQLYKPCFTLSVQIGEGRRKELVERFHRNPKERRAAEQVLAAEAGIDPHQVIIYCPSFGMSLQEADVLVRMEQGNLMQLSDSNNEEIRILKEKHKALWRFFVLIDRSAWPRRESVARSAAGYLRIN